MAKTKTTDAVTEAMASRTYWFAVLERARESGDEAKATQAMRELERLGVEVSFKEQA